MRTGQPGGAKEGKVAVLLELLHPRVNDPAALAEHTRQLRRRSVKALVDLLLQQQHRAAIITKYKLTTFL